MSKIGGFGTIRLPPIDRVIRSEGQPFNKKESIRSNGTLLLTLRKLKEGSKVNVPDSYAQIRP